MVVGRRQCVRPFGFYLTLTLLLGLTGPWLCVYHKLSSHDDDGVPIKWYFERDFFVLFTDFRATKEDESFGPDKAFRISAVILTVSVP